MSTTLTRIEQAEAYSRDRVVILRNAKTNLAADMTKKIVPGCEHVSDVSVFLGTIAPMAADRPLIVALGESTTANIHNWPFALARIYLKSFDPLVLNLADWGRCAEQNVSLLEDLFDWQRSLGVSSVCAVWLGGLHDLWRIRRRFVEFLDGGAPSFLSDDEEILKTHRFGRQLSTLIDDVPAEMEVAASWIAHRFLAVHKIQQRICSEAGALYVAILQPMAYPRFTPAYNRALLRAYEAASPTLPINEWCSANDYRVGAADFFPESSAMPIIDVLSRIWQNEDMRTTHGRYLDWLNCFFDVEENCFLGNFDAAHYSRSGVRILAEKISTVVGESLFGVDTKAAIHASPEEADLDFADFSKGFFDAHNRRVTLKQRMDKLAERPEDAKGNAELVMDLLREHNELYPGSDFPLQYLLNEHHSADDQTRPIGKMPLAAGVIDISSEAGLQFGISTTGIAYKRKEVGYGFAADDLIVVSFHLELSSKGTAAGHARITKLGHTIAGPAGLTATVLIASMNRLAGPVIASPTVGSSFLTLYQLTDTGIAPLTDEHFTDNSVVSGSVYFWRTS